MMKPFNIKLPEQLLKQAKEVAWQERKSLAELIRELLENKIRGNDDKNI